VRDINQIMAPRIQDRVENVSNELIRLENLYVDFYKGDYSR